MAIDKETAERIEQPVAAEAEREARLTPAEAVERMRIRVPVRGNRKLRSLIERVNEDKQLKAWWHVGNVNAAVRMEINDHSWVHIQIVANIALKLLRQLTKHGIEPAVVRDYGFEDDDAEIVVTLGALLHCIGMAVHREGHEEDPDHDRERHDRPRPGQADGAVEPLEDAAERVLERGERAVEDDHRASSA